MLYSSQHNGLYFLLLQFPLKAELTHTVMCEMWLYFLQCWKWTGQTLFEALQLQLFYLQVRLEQNTHATTIVLARR